MDLPRLVGCADHQDIVNGEVPMGAGRERPTVQGGAISAAQVFDQPPGILEDEPGVVLADAGINQAEVAGTVPTDQVQVAQHEPFSIPLAHEQGHDHHHHDKVHGDAVELLAVSVESY